MCLEEVLISRPILFFTALIEAFVAIKPNSYFLNKLAYANILISL